MNQKAVGAEPRKLTHRSLINKLRLRPYHYGTNVGPLASTCYVRSSQERTHGYHNKNYGSVLPLNESLLSGLGQESGCRYSSGSARYRANRPDW